MAEKLGVSEVKDILAVGVQVTKLVSALSDGVGISDLGALLSAAKAVKPAIDAVKSGKLIPELKDLDETEKAELNGYVKVELDDIDESVLGSVVEKAFSVALDLCDLLKVV